MKEFRALIARIGEPQLRKILLTFYQEMSGDILIGFFFDGKDLQQIANRQADFLLKASGVRREYSGRAPQQAHLELAPILSGHFDRRLRVLESVLRFEGLAENEIQTWIRFEESFRDSIIK